MATGQYYDAYSSNIKPFSEAKLYYFVIKAKRFTGLSAKYYSEYSLA